VKVDPTRLLDEVQRGSEVLFHFSAASWWEWSYGSALVFWRWHDNTQLALHGCRPFLLKALPLFKRKSNIPPANKRLLIASKLNSIIQWRYLVQGPVKRLIQFFDVPKVDDIGLVYNGRSCGLNQSGYQTLVLH
jgi:hypothetical protein